MNNYLQNNNENEINLNKNQNNKLYKEEHY